MPNSQEIYQQARQLLPLEKLCLAERLLADLDISTPEVDSVWHDEAAKRWQAYKDGQLKTISYEAVMQKYKP